MRKSIAALLATLALVLATATSVAAHDAGPCNDFDGDGSPSGAEYAAHHITALALGGMVGNNPNVEDTHIPGSHKGFSACLGVH